mmetsp:Transcript_129127/g.248873  ORF Transcript_129127/g.248873 Transcript_129127/m.248873 type:complete len:493 (+) Transcript_129127:90-1568(+)
MANSSVLDFHLGKAIRAEVRKEVESLRKDLEVDRQMRMHLEEQVSILQQGAADVMRWLQDTQRTYIPESTGAAGEPPNNIQAGSNNTPIDIEGSAMMQELVTTDLLALFGKYCDRQKSGLAGKDFTKLCLDAALIDRTDADLIFSQVMGTQRRMDFDHFEFALERVADKKRQELSDLRRQLARLPGPNLNDITVPDDVRLHDDQTTYTGTCSQKSSTAPTRQGSVTSQSTSEFWRSELRPEEESAPNESVQRRISRVARHGVSLDPRLQYSRSSSLSEASQSPASQTRWVTPPGIHTPTESPKTQMRSAHDGMRNALEGIMSDSPPKRPVKNQDPALTTFAERRARFGMSMEENLPSSAIESVNQIAREIDRKVGTVLRDIDQRLGAAQEYSDRVAAQAAGAATEHAKALFSQLDRRMETLGNRQDDCLATMRTAHALQTALQQKCDLLAGDVEHVRLEMGLTARASAPAKLLQTGHAMVLPPDGRYTSAPT